MVVVCSPSRKKASSPASVGQNILVRCLLLSDVWLTSVHAAALLVGDMRLAGVLVARILVADVQFQEAQPCVLQIFSRCSWTACFLPRPCSLVETRTFVRSFSPGVVWAQD